MSAKTITMPFFLLLIMAVERLQMYFSGSSHLACMRYSTCWNWGVTTVFINIYLNLCFQRPIALSSNLHCIYHVKMCMKRSRCHSPDVCVSNIKTMKMLMSLLNHGAQYRLYLFHKNTVNLIDLRKLPKVIHLL